MSDDIETLRRLAYGLGTEERKEALVAIERIKSALDKDEAHDFQSLMMAECERDSLRAKLEKARRVLFFYRDEWEASVTERRSPTNELRDDAGFKASIAISELNDDAPAQQEPGRHLTLDEQKVFHSALRKSSHVGPGMKLREAITKAGNEADLVVIQVWADTFLASLEEDGFVIVPKEATEEMLAAALPCADTDYTERDKKIGAAASLLLTGARNIPQEGDAVYAAAGLARDYRMLIAARPTIED